MSKMLLLAGLLLLGNAAASELTYEQALDLSKKQPHDVAYAYEDQWDPVNNSNHLDTRDGCYRIAPEDVDLVLVLGKSGKVLRVLAKPENEKAACFRETYLNFVFPKPPLKPYYMHLHMRGGA